MKNIADLRDDLVNIFDGLKDNTMLPEKAAQLTNCAGKIIGSLRVEMEYSDLRQERPEIDFMKKADHDNT